MYLLRPPLPLRVHKQLPQKHSICIFKREAPIRNCVKHTYLYTYAHAKNDEGVVCMITSVQRTTTCTFMLQVHRNFNTLLPSYFSFMGKKILNIFLSRYHQYFDYLFDNWYEKELLSISTKFLSKGKHGVSFMLKPEE